MRTADDSVGGWSRAHDTLRDRISRIFDHEYPRALEELVDAAMEKVKAELAHAHHELRVAEWMVSHNDGDEVCGHPRTLEEAEVGYRLFLRGEELSNAYEVVFNAPGLDDAQRWRILGVLRGIEQEAEAEATAYRDNPPPSA